MAETAKAKTPNEEWTRWHSELELARKAKGFENWQTRSKKIIKRYRDERPDATGDEADRTEGSKFNILWSNVQTLMPALFAKSPKPVVERRYLDRDDVGRTASVILERALLYELDEGCYSSSVRKAVLDRLLPGRGVVWIRYEPRFAPLDDKTQKEPEDKSASAAGAQAQPGAEQVASESVPVDYIDWCDFLTSPARIWEEVWWLAKRVYMTRDQLVKRFGQKIGSQITLDWSPVASGQQQAGTSASGGNDEAQKRAKIWEIWDKNDRKVRWLAETWSDGLLDTKDDPLHLEGFWPVPKPLYATVTNDSLIPVPDYVEYQDQAVELDDLTARISSLTKAIKACGVYDASVDELKRMLEEGFENKLVPCDNMAEFQQKAGANGMGHIWLMPVKDMADTLIQLYTAREQVKQTLYEITGLSDIVRGQAQGGGAKTATEQRIKGQFASMRLNDMQAEVARFCRDTLRIMGELIAEHFDPMTLYLISGYEQYAKEQFAPQETAAPQNPMMGHNGGPPMALPAVSPPAGAGAAMGQPPTPPPLPVDPQVVARQQAAQMFKDAVALLRSDKLRGFRIEIETDSLIEPDQQATQQSRTEFLAAVGQFLAQAVPLGEQMPQFMPLMGKMLLFGVRGYRAGRELEAAFEQMIDDLTKAAKNPQPKPPTPEEVKAQAAVQQAQLDAQAQQAKMAGEQQGREADMAMKAQEIQFEQQRLDMKRQENEMDMAMAQAKHAMEMEKLRATSIADQRQAEIDAESRETAASLDMTSQVAKHNLAMEAAEAKAAQAKNGAGA